MKTVQSKMLMVAGLAGALATTTAIGAMANGSALHSGVRLAQVRRERHPELRRALRNLQAAKQNLQKGAHDFSGHRAKALDLTNQAISEVQQAIKSDKT